MYLTSAPTLLRYAGRSLHVSIRRRRSRFKLFNIMQMFLETWKYASASTRDRMRRWIDMYAERQIFPPAVVEQIRHAVDPASLRKAPATASTSASRNDPRKAMKRPGLGAPQAASWGAPRAAPGRPMPPVPSTIHRQAPSVPGTPHPYMQPPGHVMYQRPGVAPPPMYGMPPNTIPPPMPLAPLPQAPLGTSFRGVRLQVCMINSFQASRCTAGCRSSRRAVQRHIVEEYVSFVTGDSAPVAAATRSSAQSVPSMHSCDVIPVDPLPWNVAHAPERRLYLC